jgi:hypothetical protein
VSARALLAAAALAAAASASAQESPRWGSFELAAGQYRPDVDAEFATRPGPWQQEFGDSRRWMFRAGVAKTLYRGIGSLDVGLKTGFFHAGGHGLISEGGGFTPSGDRTNFYVIPTSATLTYRFDWIAERYRWIPIAVYGRWALERYNWWVTAGGARVKERGATNGWSATGGVALLLDAFDPDLARELDRDTGINHTYLTFDVTKTKVDDFGSSKSWDLSSAKATYAFGLLFVF